MSHVLQRNAPLLLFLLSLGAVLTGFAFLLRSAAYAANPGLMALAVTVDLLLTIPLAYLLVARRYRVNLRLVVPLVLGMVVFGTLMIPAGDRGILDGVRTILIPVIELLVLAFVVWKIRAARRSYRATDSFDRMSRIRATALEVTGSPGAAAAITSELAMFAYLVSFRARPEVPEAGTAFPWHRRSGVIAIFVAVAMAVVIETAAIHFLVRMWSRPVAWVLTALSLYSLLLIIGHARAIALRPHALTPAHLHVRSGLFLSADIPREAIVSVESCSEERKGEKEVLKCSAPVSPNLRITLRETREALSVYGFRPRFRTVLFRADDPEGLAAALADEEPGPGPAGA